MNASQVTEQAALSEAIRLAGGKTSLLRRLNARGHNVGSHNTVNQWLITQVPAHYCPDIEFITGVMCEALRPDVAWAVVRNSKRSSKTLTARTSPSAKTAATAS